ncbi:hypothetical protein [Ammoniphilus sp. 3BR4]|uniref:hypothetical protein n=1 Tax=Ammoniphilus sp. 3BR4 TaxID=3158265 RepID=UPI00346561CF
MSEQILQNYQDLEQILLSISNVYEERTPAEITKMVEICLFLLEDTKLKSLENDGRLYHES